MTRLTAPQSKTAQVTEFLEREIYSGRLKPGDRLYSMRDIGSRLGVSTMVISLAIDSLSEKNLVTRRRRQGIFVNYPEKADTKFLVVQYPRNMGKESSSTYLLPEFEVICRSKNILIDKISYDFLFSGPPEKVIETTKAGRYQAVLVCNSCYFGDEIDIKILRELELPILIPHALPADNANTGFATLRSDMSRGWRDALNHLASQGYQNIGIIGIIDSHKNENLRCGSVEEHYSILAELGIKPEPVCFLDYYQPKSFEEGLRTYFAGNPKLDAVLCFSDFVALKVYKYCEKMKINIPGDLAVMGFCGYPGGGLLSPPLSTIDLQYSHIGRQAAELLINRHEWFKPGQAVPCRITPHQIIVRESTRTKAVISENHNQKINLKSGSKPRMVSCGDDKKVMAGQADNYHKTSQDKENMVLTFSQDQQYH